MTKEQYKFAIIRIKELQNPEIQPLGLQLGWELNELMTQAASYEAQHHREHIAYLESSEWNAFDRETPIYEI